MNRYQKRMTSKTQNIDHIAELLVHIGRVCRAEEGQAGLTPAQWTCLRFFARANAATRKPSAFASFQVTTRGTASQIIKTLEARGLLARHKSRTDGRSVRFDLTRAGLAMLKHDPSGDLRRLLAALDAADCAAFAGTLSGLSSALAGLKNTPAFGTCGDCRHFSTSETAGFCACMAATIEVDDFDTLCGSYCARTGSTFTRKLT